ncbi:MAG: DsbA family oxidoreductase [Proteobacteria bacterium]|nr:DsbA family oxidoreductase [Pseudomonadota bacterium]
MTAQSLRIDFVSDIACPWCVVGLRSLQQALANVGDAVQAEIHLQPFELNPDMPPEGENTAEHVTKKYGSSPERSAAARQAIKQAGEDLGFTFNYSPDSRIWNTFDAHRLLHWAEQEGRALQLKQALFKSNFTDQRPSNDPAALIDAVREAGLDPARAAQILASGEFTDEVRAIEAFWQQRGIHAVPSIIFNQHWMLQGAQPPEQFERAIRAIITGAAKPAPAP